MRALLPILLCLPALTLAAAAPARALAFDPQPRTVLAAAAEAEGAASLESAASKASEIGRTVAMSLIALGLAIAAMVLVFRRDFKEAAGVLAIGLVAVLLATPAGLTLLRDTVNTVVGGH